MTELEQLASPPQPDRFSSCISNDSTNGFISSPHPFIRLILDPSLGFLAKEVCVAAMDDPDVDWEALPPVIRALVYHTALMEDDSFLIGSSTGEISNISPFPIPIKESLTRILSSDEIFAILREAMQDYTDEIAALGIPGDGLNVPQIVKSKQCSDKFLRSTDSVDHQAALCDSATSKICSAVVNANWDAFQPFWSDELVKHRIAQVLGVPEESDKWEKNGSSDPFEAAPDSARDQSNTEKITENSSEEDFNPFSCTPRIFSWYEGLLKRGLVESRERFLRQKEIALQQEMAKILQQWTLSADMK